MPKKRELPLSKLRRECKPEIFKFKDTSEIEPFEGVIGQDRAVKAMSFGLTTRMRGFNIYLSGTTGMGKTSYAQSCIKKIAAKDRTPDDWCYIYNFDKPSQPIAVNLPAGKGRLFKKDMDDFVKILMAEITKAFDSEDYEKEKSNILKEFQSKKSELLLKLDEDAEKQGFKVKATSAGIYFQPVVEGKALSEQEYDDLGEDARREINEKTNELQLQTIEIIRKIKNIEKEAETKVAEWENKIALFAVGIHINDLKDKYRAFEKIYAYLEKVQEDILLNIGDFIGEEPSESRQQLIIPWLKEAESPADRYTVNLLVDNSGLKGAPVIADFNPTYFNLLGRMEYENEFGTMTTDYKLIKAGLFHQANGGYLILQAKDLLGNVQAWEALKRVLKTRQIAIENMKEQMGLVAVSGLKPEPIPVDVKVLLVGSGYLYQLLYEVDEDFSKLFKVKADFDEEMDWNRESLMKLAQFISAFCRRENTLHFDAAGVAKVAEYASRLAEDQNKMTTRLSDIVEVLCEACIWAQLDGVPCVSASHVRKALAEKKHRSDKYDKKLLQMLKNGMIMVDTEGETVGQINGLSVLDMGDYAFGKPSRITATTYMGESGIVNIEREVEMSGTSHAKGVLIISGYFGQKFAQELPLSLSASLCFEQLYGGVDGDSASSAELYALLSSLSDLPIKQYIAVTGSVNQRGELQPIGGATMKIEGFFELCRARGLDGRHGVIIPHQNVANLALNDDVSSAVEKRLFHIYPVKTVDEGIEILTGVKAGERRSDGTYSPDSVNYRVYEKLKRFARTAASFGKNVEN